MARGGSAPTRGEPMCLEIARRYGRPVFFAGKLVFSRERWYHRLLHNDTANALQKRLHGAGRRW